MQCSSVQCGGGLSSKCLYLVHSSKTQNTGHFRYTSLAGVIFYVFLCLDTTVPKLLAWLFLYWQPLELSLRLLCNFTQETSRPVLYICFNGHVSLRMFVYYSNFQVIVEEVYVLKINEL